MKIAIFHNFMDNIGGAELVVLALARGLDADIYTTSLNLEKIKAMGYEDVAPRITSVGAVPKMAPFRQQLALWKMRNINANKLLHKKNATADKYDFFIIGGDWAVSAAVKNKPNLWYVHSPLNELWAFNSWIRETLLSPIKRPLFDIFTWVNRMLTRRYAKHVGVWVANSRNVQARIKKYYGKDATVINPPVIMSKSRTLPDKGYWLSVNRLFAHKRVEIQMKAFAKLASDLAVEGRQVEKLIMVGSYEKGTAQFEAYKSYIESIKPANVELMHWVDDVELRKLYAECKGFITTAKDEDFGMTVIEAMACGKPVIASNEGGYKESVIDGKTGVLANYVDAPAEDAAALDQNATVLADAIRRMSIELRLNPEMYKGDCIDQAAKFDVNVFLEKIRAVIPML
jgi:glycosyltransferase involved in cell wall biosynthesis